MTSYHVPGITFKYHVNSLLLGVQTSQINMTENNNNRYLPELQNLLRLQQEYLKSKQLNTPSAQTLALQQKQMELNEVMQRGRALSAQYMMLELNYNHILAMNQELSNELYEKTREIDELRRKLADAQAYSNFVESKWHTTLSHAVNLCETTVGQNRDLNELVDLLVEHIKNL
jgi:hypothetical protein